MRYTEPPHGRRPPCQILPIATCHMPYAENCNMREASRASEPDVNGAFRCRRRAFLHLGYLLYFYIFASVSAPPFAQSLPARAWMSFDPFNRDRQSWPLECTSSLCTFPGTWKCCGIFGGKSQEEKVPLYRTPEKLVCLAMPISDAYIGQEAFDVPYVDSINCKYPWCCWGRQRGERLGRHEQRAGVLLISTTFIPA